MHGGFGGGGGGFGHSGGGGGGFHHSGGGHSSVSNHMTSGHEHHGGHAGGHPAHAEHHHHHHGGGKDDKKGGHSHAQSQGQGQSTLSHLTGLVQNGHGFLGHIAAALTGHNAATGHHTGAGQSMHLNNYLSPLQAEKKDSSDQVGNPGALSHPDNLVQDGMVSRRSHREPRILLAAVFAGLLVWMLVVQLFSGGPPVKHKQVTAYTPHGRALSLADAGPQVDPEQSEAQNSSVAPILSLLSMAETHHGPSGIGQILNEDPNSDPNEATQTDRQDQSDSDNNRGDMQASSEDNSAQIAQAMQLFQRRPDAGTGAITQSTMLAPQSAQPMAQQNMRGSMRAISHGAPVSARMTARAMGNPRRMTTDGPVPAPRPASPELLQAESLQKSAQATFAAGTFGGPRALSADEAILVGAQPKVPGASSVLRVQKPGAQAASPQAQTAISTANTDTTSEPASFSSLFVPANGVSVINQASNSSAQPNIVRRRWKSSQTVAQHAVTSARNSTIADASIYTNSPVDELGHSRKRVLTER